LLFFKDSFSNLALSKNVLLNKYQISIALNETQVLVIFDSIDEVLTRETDSKGLESFNKRVEDIVDRVK
jgi:hypothetical protein